MSPVRTAAIFITAKQHQEFVMGIVELFLQSSISLSSSAALLLICFITSVIFSSWADNGEPPGPRPLPVLGNLLQLDLRRPYLTLLKLSKKYGSVFTVYLGPQKVVVLAGYKTVKDALVNHAVEFGERHCPVLMEKSTRKHGIIWSNGDSWREMRRFALCNLRDFGMCRRACEDKIIDECQHLIGHFHNFKGEPFDLTKPVNYAVANIICSLVYGSRFEYDDPEFTSMVGRTNMNFRLLGSASVQVYNMFPRLFTWVANRRKFQELFDLNIQHSSELCRRLKETLNPHEPRGFVDAFFIHKQNLEKAGITQTHFHDENLVMAVSSLFAAGTDTSSTSLRWALLLMAKYPQIQDEVKAELSRAIGSRQVKMEDRKNLPFTDAVIHETLRLSSIIPMSVPHQTSQDIVFRGHFIKKGTIVYPLLHSVLRDEDEWEEPNIFNPAHFLDKDGKFFKPDAFLPFSAGPRACLGEGLARMELFIFFVTLLQRFRFCPAPGVQEEDLDLQPAVGAVLNPRPHELCAVACV